MVHEGTSDSGVISALESSDPRGDPRTEGPGGLWQRRSGSGYPFA